jgi:hypothetical protein
MIKKYQVTVTRTDTYNVEIDDAVFNAEWAKEFSSVFWDIDPENAAQEAAEDIARMTARFGTNAFLEGYGFITVKDSDYSKYLKEKGNRYAEGVTIEEEDVDNEEMESEYLGEGGKQ